MNVYKIFFWIIWFLTLPNMLMVVGMSGFEIFDFSRFFSGFLLIEFILTLILLFYFICPILVVLLDRRMRKLKRSDKGTFQ